jgi:hypothetical protein
MMSNHHGRPQRITRAGLLLLAATSWAHRRANAQEYYNLDAGRPTRVEDASPAARYELDLQWLPLRYERLTNGMRRWRIDPKIAFGVAPFTEIELRAPFLTIQPPQSELGTTSGFGGLAVGGLHAFGLETGSLPAVALAGEWLLPVGSLAARTGSYSGKLLATKTFPYLRLHANVGYGTWAVRPAADVPRPPQCDFILAPGATPPPGCDAPVSIPDTPCDRIPMDRSAQAQRSMSLPPVQREDTPSSAIVPSVAPLASSPSIGSRWMAGIGIDHAFALSSTLVAADVVAERYIGLFPSPDWSAELGVRHQWSPQLVLDLGVARHFTGVLQSNAVNFGLSFAMPVSTAPERE